MTRLKELQDIFIEVIVHYHHIKMSTPADKASELDKEVKGLSRDELYQRLLTLIQESTSQDGSKTRLSLMMYLHYHIDQLQSCIDHPGIMPEAIFNTIKTQWIEMLTVVHKLLKSSFYEPSIVKYNEQEQSIPGLVRGMLKGYTLCAAGLVLQQAMHKVLNTNSDVPLAVVSEVTLDYFNAHELELSKKALNDQQKMVEKLTQEVDRLKLDQASRRSMGSADLPLRRPALNARDRSTTISSQPVAQTPSQHGPAIATFFLPRISSTQNLFSTTLWGNFFDKGPQSPQNPNTTSTNDDIDDYQHSPDNGPQN